MGYALFVGTVSNHLLSPATLAQAAITCAAPSCPRCGPMGKLWHRFVWFKKGMFNLDSSDEGTRVSCWRRVWVGATTRNATAFEEEQHPQTRRQQQNRVRSALTQEVISNEATNINVHNDLVKITIGQLM